MRCDVVARCVDGESRRATSAFFEFAHELTRRFVPDDNDEAKRLPRYEWTNCNLVTEDSVCMRETLTFVHSSIDQTRTGSTF